MSLPDGMIPQFRPRTMISTRKVMVSTFWSPLGFLVTTELRPRTKFTVACFCSDIIPKIIEGIPFDLANSAPQLMLHMDNATPIPGIDHMLGEIANPSNRSPAVLPGLATLWLLSVWEAEGCFGRARIQVHRRIPFGDQGGHEPYRPGGGRIAL
jgi:hypothetical protein